MPEIQPGEVLVRVAACGVCASELDHWRGGSSGLSYPYFLGHEVSGVIERAGSPVDSLCPGDPVAVWCTSRGLAEYVAVDAGHCFSAGDVPLELALGTFRSVLYQDANGDVGGKKPVVSEAPPQSGDGYETLVFDQGQGSDPDAAWARVDPNDPSSVQIAFKRTSEDIMIQRTGVGSGDLISWGKVLFLGAEIERSVLVARGVHMTVMYTGPGIIQRGDLQFTFNLDYRGSDAQTGLSDGVEANADAIVASFQLKK